MCQEVFVLCLSVSLASPLNYVKYAPFSLESLTSPYMMSCRQPNNSRISSWNILLHLHYQGGSSLMQEKKEFIKWCSVFFFFFLKGRALGESLKQVNFSPLLSNFLNSPYPTPDRKCFHIFRNPISILTLKITPIILSSLLQTNFLLEIKRRRKCNWIANKIWLMPFPPYSSMCWFILSSFQPWLHFRIT